METRRQGNPPGYTVQHWTITLQPVDQVLQAQTAQILTTLSTSRHPLRDRAFEPLRPVCLIRAISIGGAGRCVLITLPLADYVLVGG